MRKILRRKFTKVYGPLRDPLSELRRQREGLKGNGTVYTRPEAHPKTLIRQIESGERP